MIESGLRLYFVGSIEYSEDRAQAPRSLHQDTDSGS